MSPWRNPMPHYDLEVIRHSCAHLMAQAIFRLFPNEKVQLGVGPTIEEGFYYDIKMEHKLTEEDLKQIEQKMKEIVKEDLLVVRRVLSRQEALDYFSSTGQDLKVELIQDLPENEEISCYTQGEFTDLCRGPHVERTGHLPLSFKLLHTAGAYWRGDADRAMLQRVYATCFENKDKLKEYLTFMEEAKKRDHRRLGVDLELFVFDTRAPASPFFTPKGAFIYNQLVDFMRQLYVTYEYQEVITPQILDVELWHTSGHYENYKDNMYFTKIDEREFAVKPMNCPCHMLLYKHFKYSYRDLPLRMADFGRLHRYEKSGTLAGLTRVRTFCQDDGHIFLPLSEVQAEIGRVMEMYFTVYDHFGLKDARIFLSTRPPKKIGDDSIWDTAENGLKEALEKSGRPFQINEGDGAFYGPKIDFQLADALKRYHQLGTIQLDFNLPERFDLKFTNQQGELERPVVIHRALLGSLERFFAIYLEHVGGAYPFWLAPEQAVIVPVANDRHTESAKVLHGYLKKLGFRVKVDDRPESMGLKTRQIQMKKIPFMLVIGDREMESQTVSVRAYGEKQSVSWNMDQLTNEFLRLKSLRLPPSLRE
ncbi:MAG: threonine--tRNA ligase [Pseudomonadota bacterium]